MLTIVGCVGSSVWWILAVCAVLVIISPVEFYGYSEPASMLQPLRSIFSPNQLLWFKFKQGFVLEMFVFLPFWGCWCIRFADGLRDTVIGFGIIVLLSITMIGVAIVSKYAFWKAGMRQTLFVSLMVGLVGYCLWLPMVFPLPEILFYFLFRKAQRTLQAIQ